MMLPAESLSIKKVLEELVIEKTPVGETFMTMLSKALVVLVLRSLRVKVKSSPAVTLLPP